MDFLGLEKNLPLPNFSKPPLVGTPLDINAYVVLFPGASGPLKEWPAEKLLEWINLILSKTNKKIVLCGGKDVLEIGAKLTKSIPTERLWNAIAHCSLAETLAIIAHASHVVSGDTFAGHAADAFGVPASVLFGATSPQFGFVPPGSGSKILYAHMSCSPCTRHGKGTCRFGNKMCLQNIAAEDVFYDVVARQQ